jgi:hypothetical protein
MRVVVSRETGIIIIINEIVISAIDVVDASVDT